MIIWGGTAPNYNNKAGGRYDPGTDSWTRTSMEGLPDSGRSGHTAVWTGSGMLIFGGTDSQRTFQDSTYFYSLARPMYLYKKP